MLDFLARMADRMPWQVWLITGTIGLIGTFGLAAKGMRHAKFSGLS